jgi:hypothetical protein
VSETIDQPIRPTLVSDVRIKGNVGRISPSGIALRTLYNLILYTHSNYISVPLVGAERVPRERILSRRGIAVVLLVLTLTASLANRVVHVSSLSKPTAHSSASYEKLQHRDRDADEWAPPVAQLSLLWVNEPALPPETGETVHLRVHCNSLYNRPPPLS